MSEQRYRISRVQIPVRPGDLDSVGHVNNARALEYLEHGRWIWMRDQGLNDKGNIIPVVSRVIVDYRREIFWGDITVSTRLVDDPEAVYKALFEQSVTLEGATDTAITAQVHVAFINTADRGLCTVEEFLSEHTRATIGE